MLRDVSAKVGCCVVVVVEVEGVCVPVANKIRTVCAVGERNRVERTALRAAAGVVGRGSPRGHVGKALRLPIVFVSDAHPSSFCIARTAFQSI